MVVRQSVRLSITTKALLSRGLAVAWLAVYGKSIQMMNGGSEEAKTLLIFPRRSAKTKHHENIIAKPVNKVQIF